MDNCESCQHWTPPAAGETTAACTRIGLGTDRKTTPMIFTGQRHAPRKLAVNAFVVTPADFGCKLHEHRQEDPTP